MEHVNENETMVSPVEDNVKEVKWDREDSGYLDLEYYSDISKLSKMVLYGAILTQLFAVISIFVDKDSNALFNTYVVINALLYLALGIFAYWALVRGKSNAMFLTRWMLLICLISWVLNFVLTLIFDPRGIVGALNIYGIIVLIWCVSGLIMTYSGSDCKEAFPESSRSHSLFDLILVILNLCVYLLPFFLILIAQINRW